MSSPGSVTPGPLISEVLGTQERLETGVVCSLVTTTVGSLVTVETRAVWSLVTGHREMVTGREGCVVTTHHGDIRLTGHQGHMTTPSNQNWREFSPGDWDNSL